mmetsp:Transcript_50550/g.163677  ORF Transcript_50550/g.163677 Transcript_50550/m.163677 type:complete len:221 (+) Transcript_50550:1417-2079(+)
MPEEEAPDLRVGDTLLGHSSNPVVADRHGDRPPRRRGSPSAADGGGEAAALGLQERDDLRKRQPRDDRLELGQLDQMIPSALQNGLCQFFQSLVVWQPQAVLLETPPQLVCIRQLAGVIHAINHPLVHFPYSFLTQVEDALQQALPDLTGVEAFNAPPPSCRHVGSPAAGQATPEVGLLLQELQVLVVVRVFRGHLDQAVDGERRGGLALEVRELYEGAL